MVSGDDAKVRRAIKSDDLEALEELPSVEALQRLGTRTTASSLNSEVVLASDLDGESGTTARYALETYENTVGRKEAQVVQTVCDAWQSNLVRNI